MSPRTRMVVDHSQQEEHPSRLATYQAFIKVSEAQIELKAGYGLEVTSASEIASVVAFKVASVAAFGVLGQIQEEG